MSNYFKIISVFVLLLIGGVSTIQVSAQDEEAPVLIFEGRITDMSNKKLPGVSVEFKKNGTTFKTSTTASSGKYESVETDFGHVYAVSFSKPGYVTKTLYLDTDKGFYPEEVERQTFMELSVSLFAKQEDVDYSIVTNKPVAKAHMDPATGKLDWDFAYVGQRKKEIDKFLQDLENKANQNEEEFKNLVKEGDKAFTSSDYQKAIDKYEAALKLKQDEDVETKIADAEIKLEELAEQQKLDEDFNKAIQKGDQLLASNKFDDAIAAYNEAKGLKPADSLPDTKIAEANKKKAEAEGAELTKQYNEKMNEALKAFTDKDYTYAKTLYQEASNIKPKERDPKDKIAEIDAIIKKQIEDEQKYNQFLADGEKAMLNESYDQAITNFEEALKIKPDESLPKEQLDKAKELKKKAEEAAGKEQQYQNLITKANGEFDSEKWETSKTTYQEALGLKPGEKYPTDRIAEIDAKLKELEDQKKAEEEKNRQFEALMQEADGVFNSQEWDNAIAKYTEASTLKPDEQLPKDKIAEIQKKKQELQDAETAKRGEYDNFVAEGNKLMGQEKWDDAKASFNQALGLYPDEQLPKDKIAEIDAKLNELAQAAQEEEQKKTQFDQLMASGTSKLDAGQLKEAKDDFNAALDLFPNEQGPKDKIAEVDAQLENLAQEEAKEQEFQDKIKEGDVAKDAGQWDQAKQLYKEAHDLKPEETLTQGKIDEVNQLMEEEKNAEVKQQYQKIIDVADEQLAQENFAKAKELYERAKTIDPNDTYPDEKLAEIKQKEEEIAANAENEAKYKEAVNRADNQFESQKWDEAINSYNEALSYVEKDYPKEQIDKINQKKQEMVDAAAAEEAKRAQYDELINQGNSQFTAEDWNGAKDSYTKALELFDEDHPRQRLDEIANKLSALEAADAKAKEYNDLITQANTARDGKDWDNAKQLYKDANAVKPSETYPQEQIDWINQEMQRLADEELNQQYQKIIDVANEKFDASDYSKAKELFERAQGMRPSDPYPPQKIAEIEKLLKNNELESTYVAAIDKANAARDAKDWDNAKQLYKEANAIKPSETYPQEQIDWINQEMKRLADEELDKQYQKIIDKANELFTAEEYEKSKGLYERAKGIRPSDPYPPKRINEIDQLLKDMAADKADEEAQKLIDEKYDGLISRANSARDNQDWNNAKGLYKEANGVKPSESYPQEQIDWINKEMERLAKDEVEKQYRKVLDVADQKFEAEDYEKARSLYERAIGMKPDDSYPPNQIRRIDDALAALANKNKANDEYSKYIDEGNQSFSSENYRKSLGAFQNALDLKPSAPYPQQKIDEINDILDQLAAQKIQQQSEDSKKNHEEFLKNPYGEEVTGKYTEKDVDLLMTQGRIDEDDYKNEIIQKRKDMVIEELDEETDFQKERGDDNYDDFERLNTKRSLEEAENDDPRKELIPQVESYKDEKLTEEDDREDVGRSVTYGNRADLEELRTERFKEETDNDLPRQDMIPQVEKYKDVKLDEKTELTEEGIRGTYETRGDLEELRTERFKEETDNDLPRQDMIPQVEKYKDVKLDEKTELTEEGIRGTYETRDDLEELRTERFKEETDNDIPRQDMIPQVEKYKDVKLDEKTELTEEGIRGTYETRGELEELRTERFKEEADNDIPRQEMIPQVDTYKDGLSDLEDTRMDYGTKVTYGVEDQLEELETRITEFAEGADVPRQEMIPEVDHYKDKNLTILALDEEAGKDKTYNLYTEKEHLETKRNEEYINADDPRKENAVNMVDYTDDRLDAIDSQNKADIDKADERANRLDEVKHYSDTRFVDENQQKLAEQYPQGVTEKMYERRNGNGVVIEVTIIRIVVKGNKGDEYKKVTSRWGTYHFKNGGAISEMIWDTETSGD